MKFSQMPYERPDLEAVKAQLNEFNERLARAESYEVRRLFSLRGKRMRSMWIPWSHWYPSAILLIPEMNSMMRR